MDHFRERVAVITGGGGGIGAALADAFAARGARIVLADLDEAAMARVAERLTRSGADVLAVPTDVTQLGSVRALAEAAARRFGAVHLVCNNAGVGTFGELATATHADWEYTMRVNFWGVVHGVEIFVPRLIAQGAGGHVINTASMAGLVGMQWLGVYCASKFAVVGLTEALHRELRPHGIGVSVLCPMIVRTNINENSVRNRPAELRNPGDPVVPPAGALVGSTIAPEEVARRVMRGVERQDVGGLRRTAPRRARAGPRAAAPGWRRRAGRGRPRPSGLARASTPGSTTRPCLPDDATGPQALASARRRHRLKAPDAARRRPGPEPHLHLSVLPDGVNPQLGPPASGNTASPHWPFEACGESMTTVPFTGSSLGSVM